MPCTKCEEGKYKWGETGDCQYDTLQDCEDANSSYKEMKTTKIVELIIADDSEELAIDAISLVSAPAIEQDFVFFGKQKNNLTFAKVDEEKRMLISPALIPDKQIFRYDPNTDTDYYVYFSKATVRKASELYLKHNNHHKATYEHQDRVSGVLTVESWIIEDTKMDKSKLYGFSLPKGTWMVKMKIENDDLWQEIKSGTLKGLSIEGYFTNKFEQMNKKEPTTEQILSALNELVRESRTELSTEMIHLGLASDIKKQMKKSADTTKAIKKQFAQLKTATDKLAKLQPKAEKAVKEFKAIEKSYVPAKTTSDKVSSSIISDFNKGVKEEGKLNTLLRAFEKAAVELGIDLQKNKLFSSASSVNDNMNFLLQDTDKLLKRNKKVSKANPFKK